MAALGGADHREPAVSRAFDPLTPHDVVAEPEIVQRVPVAERWVTIGLLVGVKSLPEELVVLLLQPRQRILGVWATWRSIDRGLFSHSRTINGGDAAELSSRSRSLA
jgi:hypothetical protein